MNKRTNLLSIALFTIAIALSACGNKKSAQQQGASQVIKDYPVLTLQLRHTTLDNKYPATIEGQQNIEIRPKIDGYIEAIYIDEGAVVRTGQPLFKISAPQYEQEVRTAQANIKIAQANVNTAEMEVNKVRPLVEKDIISQYELESAEFNLQSKQAALAQAQATLVNAQVNLGYTRVLSPVNGIVGTIPYRIGSLVSSNTAQPLTTVSNIGKIYAYFSLNEKQILEFAESAEGKSLQSILGTMPPVSLIMANGVPFPQQGKIETVSGLINTSTGSVSVRATFPNPDNVIRSGSSGIVVIPQYIKSSIIIPQKSTFEIQGQKFVYVVGEDNQVSSREVEVLSNNDGRFYVVRNGLKPGDRIVVEGIGSMRDGDQIQPEEVNAEEIYKEEGL